MSYFCDIISRVWLKNESAEVISSLQMVGEKKDLCAMKTPMAQQTPRAKAASEMMTHRVSIMTSRRDLG